MKKIITIILCVILWLSVTGCAKEQGVEVQVQKAAAGSKPFLITMSKEAEVKQYINNFQSALNSVSTADIKMFVNVTEPSVREYLNYLSNADLKNLFRFYMGAIELNFIELVEFNGKTFAAVEVSYYDNRYNDFHKPQIVDNINPRQEFYDTVDVMLKKQQQEYDDEVGLNIKDDTISDTVREAIELGIIVQEDKSTPKSTSHKGFNYNSKQDMDEWTGLLEAKRDELKLFKKIMFFELTQTTEITTMTLAKDDLITLFGNLPVFYGLNSIYDISSYDLFYNYMQFLEVQIEQEQEAFAAWDALQTMSDEQLQELSLSSIKDNKVFGIYDINTELDKIRQNTLPTELGAIFTNYYSDTTRAYYTFLFENREYYDFIQTLQPLVDYELIRQSGKDFQVVITLPDINKLMLQHNDTGVSAPEMLEKIHSQLRAEAYETTSVYSKVTLQQSRDTKWGFVMTTPPMRQVLLSAVHPDVLSALGLDALLTAKLDKDGFLMESSENIRAIQEFDVFSGEETGIREEENTNQYGLEEDNEPVLE